jgi:hypothetical protein
MHRAIVQQFRTNGNFSTTWGNFSGVTVRQR